MSKVYRVYVEKRKDFAVEADEIFENLKTQLKLSNLEGVSVVNRYDVQGITKEVLDQGVDTILAEPMVDDVYYEEYPTQDVVFGIEFLPGQYDQRGDWAAQCIQIVNEGNRPEINTAKVYILTGNITDEQFNKIIELGNIDESIIVN